MNRSNSRKEFYNDSIDTFSKKSEINSSEEENKTFYINNTPKIISNNINSTYLRNFSDYDNSKNNHSIDINNTSSIKKNNKSGIESSDNTIIIFNNCERINNLPSDIYEKSEFNKTPDKISDNTTSTKSEVSSSIYTGFDSTTQYNLTLKIQEEKFDNIFNIINKIINLIFYFRIKNENYKELLDNFTDEQIKVLKNIANEKNSKINDLYEKWDPEIADENDEHNIMQIASVMIEVLKKKYEVKSDENSFLNLNVKVRELIYLIHMFQHNTNEEIRYNFYNQFDFISEIYKDINKYISSKNENLIKYEIEKSTQSNSIIIVLYIHKKDIGNKIYFIDNTDGDYFLEEEKDKFIPHHNNNFENLNETNTELYINKKPEKFEKFFIPKQQGLYQIKLIINTKLTNCRYMFYNCESIIELDLSRLNTEEVKDMSYMFSGCKNVSKINLSKLKTQNVTNMEGIFYNCNNLTEIDLSNFKTENLTNLKAMFYGCIKLSNINQHHSVPKKLLI